ncbi:class I SAM-dependent methyltransferase, partial [Peribacillus sp. SIMBA_075]
GRVVGLDFSQNMLDVGAYKVANAGVGNRIKLVNADAMKLPYEDNSFDFATIGFALRNVPDVQRVLNEMARVVKPGGKVVSLEVSK